jgi:DUF1680 family protein
MQTGVFTPVKLGCIKPAGWLREHFKRELEGFAGHLDELTVAANSRTFFERRVYGGDSSSYWDAEATGNWMEGISQSAKLGDSAEAWEKCEAFVKDLLRTQDADGYIGIYVPEERFQKKRNDGELWALSRALLILINYYDFTGRRETLDAAIRAAKLAMDKYGPGRSYYQSGIWDNDGGGPAHGLTMVDALCRLQEFTGDKGFIDFAEFLYQDYSENQECFGTSEMMSGNVHQPDMPFFGHGVHFCELLRVPILLYSHTGKEAYRETFLKAVAKIRECAVPSGVCRSDEFSGLPFPESGVEYCSITELMISMMRAFEITGDTAYADWAELIMYNMAQGNRRPDGKTIAYCSAENITHADGITNGTPNSRWDYSPAHEDVAVCCAPNAARVTPYFTRGLINTQADGTLALCFYAPCTALVKAGGADVRVTIDTAYPFGETVRIKIETSSPASFPLKLRIPGWAVCSKLSAEAESDGKYYRINKTWQGAEEMTLTLTPKLEFVETVDGRLSLKRGPLFYVLKIEEQAVYTRDYALPDFHDINFVAREGQVWDYSMIRGKAGDMERVFTFERQEGGAVYPWEKPNQRILAKLVDTNGRLHEAALVPMGCTCLRISAFKGITYGYDYFLAIERAAAKQDQVNVNNAKRKQRENTFL